MPKLCYCGLKSRKSICKYALIMPLLAYTFVKETFTRRGMVAVHFLLQSQGGTSELMNKSLILSNKQLLSNMIDCEATQVPHHQNCLPHRQIYILLKPPSLSLHYAVQITHSLNSKRVWHACAKAENTCGINPNIPHTRTYPYEVSATKHPPYNQ